MQKTSKFRHFLTIHPHLIPFFLFFQPFFRYDDVSNSYGACPSQHCLDCQNLQTKRGLWASFKNVK